MRVKVEVTERLIRKAKRRLAKGERRSMSCPIALALQEALGNNMIACGYTAIELFQGEKIGSLPLKASSYAYDFDSTSKMNPFSFTINIKKEYVNAKQ